MRTWLKPSRTRRRHSRLWRPLAQVSPIPSGQPGAAVSRGAQRSHRLSRRFRRRRPITTGEFVLLPPDPDRVDVAEVVVPPISIHHTVVAR